jgi:hypothetical protein
MELKRRLGVLEVQHNTLTSICTVLARQLKDMQNKVKNQSQSSVESVGRSTNINKLNSQQGTKSVQQLLAEKMAERQAQVEIKEIELNQRARKPAKKAKKVKKAKKTKKVKAAPKRSRKKKKEPEPESESEEEESEDSPEEESEVESSEAESDESSESEAESESDSSEDESEDESSEEEEPAKVVPKRAARKTAKAKAPAKKAPARKTAAKKAPARKTAAKKAPAKTGTTRAPARGRRKNVSTKAKAGSSAATSNASAVEIVDSMRG